MRDVLETAALVVAGTALESEVGEVAKRFERPLRVAIAGRTKAGKSTLLNALVGERLAATDATECTRVVTWYRHDLGYHVEAVLRTGARRSLDFDRSAGLDIHLGELTIGEIDHLEVGWPSSRLARLTLIDTPGIDATSPDVAARTLDALIGDAGAPTEADAVVYLMRHLHARDAAFLEAFDAAGSSLSSPITAIALLSRADEIGAGRPDALASAAGVARRYAADPRVASLTMTVLPVAGLLGETGASLREDEVAALRTVAALDAETRAALLLSADRFRSTDTNPLEPAVRERLLTRFGLFGLRFVVASLHDRPGLTGTELARQLMDASGIRQVEDVLRRHFAERAEALKARSALLRLRDLSARAAGLGSARTQQLAAAVERAEATWPELGELRLLHLVHARLAQLTDEERAEVARLFGKGGLAVKVGSAAEAPLSQVRSATIAAIERWRSRAGSPLVDRRTAETAEGIARAYEGLYAELEGQTSPS